MSTTVAPAGLPVVLLHGARVSRTMWRPQLEALARAGRTALAIDLPGHGERLDERFTVDGAVAAVAEGVDRVGGRAVVVGMSLGGYTGIAHAARHPEQVAGLVAAGCSSVPRQAASAAWLLAVRHVFMRLPDKGAWLNQRLVDAALPPDGARAAAEGGFALEVMDDLLVAMRGTDPLADLARVACPVWIVNGQWDHFRLQERRFVAAARDGRLVVVPRATHLASLVRPVAFTRVLLEVLEEVDAREGQAVRRSSQARTPPARAAESGTTTTSSPRAASARGVMRRALPPPR
ncbi:MAG: alpha/beta hydrolase [Actinomycetales bacterium]|jgi:pimeloyl-ACP methyl ester carboxylesterase|nr:alpha/beta hydrolase [Actinomycetales bacterium]